MNIRVHKLLLALILLLSGLLPGTRAEAQTLAATAIVLSKNNCQFNNPSSATLNFGTLDPLNPVDVTVNTTLSFVCRGSDPVATFSITDDDGLHDTGLDQNRMQRLTAPLAYLPYSITLSPKSGNAQKNVDQTLNVSAKVLGTAYQTAPAGTYTDTVTLTIQP